MKILISLIFLFPITGFALNYDRIPASESPLNVTLDLESSVAKITRSDADGKTDVICHLKDKLQGEIKKLSKQKKGKLLSKNISSEVKQKIAKACGI